MFELGQSTVHSVVSKMIINEDLHAVLDEPSAVIVTQRAEPTRQQSLALQLSEKVNMMFDINDKLFNARTGDVFWNRQQGKSCG